MEGDLDKRVRGIALKQAKERKKENQRGLGKTVYFTPDFDMI
jgi:hypothetical protein